MSKPPYIPFEKLKAEVSIQQVMDYTGLPFKRVNTNEYRCECPIHPGDKRGLVVNTSVKDKDDFPGVFSCWKDPLSKPKNPVGGDKIAFLAHTRGTTKQYVAGVDLCKAYAPHLLPPELQNKEQESRPVETQEATVPSTIPEEKDEEVGSRERGFTRLPYLQHENEVVQALGITPEIAKALDIGFSPRGVHRGRIAIAVRTEDGKLAGYLSIPTETSVQLPPRWHL